MTLGGDWLHKILSNDLFEKIGILLEGTNLDYMEKCASNVKCGIKGQRRSALGGHSIRYRLAVTRLDADIFIPESESSCVSNGHHPVFNRST